MLSKQGYLETQFFFKMICCIDERVYLWLNQCIKSEYITKPATNILWFDTIFRCIYIRWLFFNIPKLVKEVQPRREDTG